MRRLFALILLVISMGVLSAADAQSSPDASQAAGSTPDDFRLQVQFIPDDEDEFPQFPEGDENALVVTHNGDLQRSWYAASPQRLFVHVSTEDGNVLGNETVPHNLRDGIEITLYETPERRCQIVFTVDEEVFPSQFCEFLGAVLFFNVSSAPEGYDMDIVLSSAGLGFLDGFAEGEEFRIATAFNDQDTPGDEGEALQVISAPDDSYSPQVNAALPVPLESGQEYRIWAHFLGGDVDHDAFYVGLGDPNSTESQYKDIMGRVKTNEIWGVELWETSEEKSTYTADTTGLEILVLGAAETEVIIGEILLLPEEISGTPQGHCGDLELVAQ
jgi:hypothetical protein